MFDVMRLFALRNQPPLAAFIAVRTLNWHHCCAERWTKTKSCTDRRARHRHRRVQQGFPRQANKEVGVRSRSPDGHHGRGLRGVRFIQVSRLLSGRPPSLE